MKLPKNENMGVAAPPGVTVFREIEGRVAKLSVKGDKLVTSVRVTLGTAESSVIGGFHIRLHL